MPKSLLLQSLACQQARRAWRTLMNRREARCCFLPSFHLMTILLRSHPCPHHPVCPLTLPRRPRLLCARRRVLPLRCRCQTHRNHLSASLCCAWLASAFQSCCRCLKRSLHLHIAVDKAWLVSHRIRTFPQHSTCKKAALLPFALPRTARRVPACSLQCRHQLLQAASPRQPHLSPRRHPLLRRRRTLLDICVMGSSKPAVALHMHV
jgi:hypothetical protein